jgi:hypothetical protein
MRKIPSAQRFTRRSEWWFTLALGLLAALLVWKEQGAIAAWVAVLVIIGLAVEFGLFLALFYLVWGLFRRNISRVLLRQVLLFGVAAVLVHVLSPTPMSVVPRIAAAMAVVVFTAMKIFR